MENLGAIGIPDVPRLLKLSYRLSQLLLYCD
ncbi:hypothetical protein [Marinilactibacillus psychrotolerans]